MKENMLESEMNQALWFLVEVTQAGGARPQVVAEFCAAAGANVSVKVVNTPEPDAGRIAGQTFLVAAQPTWGGEVSSGYPAEPTSGEVPAVLGPESAGTHEGAGAQQPPDGDDVLTRPMVDRALTDLGYLSGREQAQVIRYCLEHGESVSRDKVYELTKRDAGKMLRGFTRPVTRVVGGLKDEGVIPSGAPELLVAGYKRGSGAAARFSVPREWREAYNRAA